MKFNRKYIEDIKSSRDILPTVQTFQSVVISAANSGGIRFADSDKVNKLVCYRDLF